MRQRPCLLTSRTPPQAAFAAFTSDVPRCVHHHLLQVLRRQLSGVEAHLVLRSTPSRPIDECEIRRMPEGAMVQQMNYGR